MKSWLERSPLVAILRGVRPDEVQPICDALAAEGVFIAEVPLNSPDPIESIRRLAKSHGDHMLIGAGTVLTVEQVDQVADAGGRVIVMPHSNTAIVRAAKAKGLLTAPGFMTPTEAFALLQAGADALKLFPAEAASPTVLKAMRAVLPAHVPILPVGGVAGDNIGSWLAAGAAGFGIGGSIYKPGDSAAVVGQKARTLMAAYRAATA